MTHAIDCDMGDDCTCGALEECEAANESYRAENEILRRERDYWAGEGVALQQRAETAEMALSEIVIGTQPMNHWTHEEIYQVARAALAANMNRGCRGTKTTPSTASSSPDPSP